MPSRTDAMMTSGVRRDPMKAAAIRPAIPR
jgi:hypothetical protein